MGAQLAMFLLKIYHYPQAVLYHRAQPNPTIKTHLSVLMYMYMYTSINTHTYTHTHIHIVVYVSIS